MDIPRLINGPCTLKEVVILTEGGPGSCQIDIWKANLSAHYPPVLADSIFTTLPAISSGTLYQDSVLTGVTTALTSDDVLLFHLLSSTNFTLIQVQLRTG
jgi:hypothetical protein